MTIAIPIPSVIAGSWTVDQTHSTLSFGVRHLVVSTYRGQLRDFDASLVSDGERVSLTGSGSVRNIDVRETPCPATFSPRTSSTSSITPKFG